MALRYLLILAVIWVLFLLIRRLFQLPEYREKPKEGASVDIVSCSHCGVHLPRPEALQREGYFYCCQAHQDEDQEGDGME